MFTCPKQPMKTQKKDHKSAGFNKTPQSRKYNYNLIKI